MLSTEPTSLSVQGQSLQRGRIQACLFPPSLMHEWFVVDDSNFHLMTFSATALHLHRQGRVRRVWQQRRELAVPR